MTHKLKARAVNFHPVAGDRHATAAKIAALIDKAADDGCNLIVFPEMALHGFERCPDCGNGTACARHLGEAECADGPLMRELAGLARRRDIYAIVGFGERDRELPVIYNAAAMLGPEGLIGTARKMGLGRRHDGPPVAEDMFANGQEIAVFATRYGPVGVGICYDMWINPEVPRIMMLKGARILAIPTATAATTRPGDLEAMAFTRTRENSVFVINANLTRGGFDPDEPEDAEYFGHSHITGPEFPHMAKVLARSDGPESVVTADIDLAQANWLKLPERRMAGGDNAHISRIVAREFSALAGV
jgi:predicted amidohydrolase